MLWSPLRVMRDSSRQMTVNSMEGKIYRENLPRAMHFSYRIDLKNTRAVTLKLGTTKLCCIQPGLADYFDCSVNFFATEVLESYTERRFGTTSFGV